ncbi:Bug family tripartite tricarboxylate transporter substrate binding protein [Terrihabitans rhizophilus]|uniref:Tripartite tricarboxylate transporter substrate-binding protein n=1 Tax=Terrihabitans rhizophilus TaxID=3092662 RepID=A0ABU4RL37_9HYPH|nr:tripartite tricarboxylate transporter substrate-binding protein [Terrihabitans sp. PJ23]MDX6805549.1 tripartite tricarboxylate transporter substrate-binding protein [Terrihabitans sp. PJ23]
MKLTRRELGLGLVAVGGAAALGIGPSRAQPKSLEIIAAAGPGGGYDTLARTVQQIAQERKLISNAQVINVPGAGGTVGLAQFVNAKKPNGLLTIGLGMVGAITLNKSPVTLDQITPAARLQGEYQPLVVSAKSDIKTLDDLMAKYKADPGSVSWGGFGIGSPDHFVSALVIKAGGGDVKKMNYIVVGAGGEMLPFVISGKVTVATGGYAEFADHIKSGALRAIGISSPQRLAGIDVPTFKEQGYDAELVNWRGFAAAPGLSGADLAALDSILSEVARSEQWADACRTRGWENLHMPAAEFKTFMEAEKTRIAGLLKELGLAT